MTDTDLRKKIEKVVYRVLPRYKEIRLDGYWDEPLRNMLINNIEQLILKDREKVIEEINNGINPPLEEKIKGLLQHQREETIWWFLGEMDAPIKRQQEFLRKQKLKLMLKQDSPTIAEEKK